MKHRVRRAMAALTVLASTLVVGTATPALAATTYGTFTTANNGQMYAVVPHWYDDPQSQDAVYQIAGATFAPCTFTGYPPAGECPNGGYQMSGGSATLSLGYDFEERYVWQLDTTDCIARNGNPTNLRVEIRNYPGGGIVGSPYNLNIPNGSCYGTASPTVYFDNDPLDGDNADGALAPGTYEIYMKFDGTDTDAAMYGFDSRGAHGVGPSNFSEYGYIGKFVVGYQYLLGWYQSSKSDVDAVETTLGGGNQLLAASLSEHWLASVGGDGLASVGGDVHEL